jgi:hypothetical protein
MPFTAFLLLQVCSCKWLDNSRTLAHHSNTWQRWNLTRYVTPSRANHSTASRLIWNPAYFVFVVLSIHLKIRQTACNGMASRGHREVWGWTQVIPCHKPCVHISVDDQAALRCFSDLASIAPPIIHINLLHPIQQSKGTTMQDFSSSPATWRATQPLIKRGYISWWIIGSQGKGWTGGQYLDMGQW